jgi:nucleotide-binding universal stress UspA family protein
MNTPTKAVVVAIGPDGHDAAVAFAVAEARRTQRPLHLVHVLEQPAAYAYVGVSDGLLDAARRTLDEATVSAEALAAPDVEVTAELVDHGWIVDDLVRRTDDVSVLVLQHRALSRIKRVFTGSTAQRVARRAHTPVISVPQGWDPEAPTRGVVTAAVQDPVEAAELLRVAFEEAASRNAKLAVLNAWWLASGYDIVVVDDGFRDEESKRFQTELAPVLEPLQEKYDGVPVTVTVQHAPPVEAVLDAAERSDLLIIGRRHHLLPLGSHFGPVTRSALEHAPCPVLIAPEPAADESRYSG